MHVAPRSLALAAFFLLAGCGNTQPAATGLDVIATTSTLASLAEAVTGDRAHVSTLVPVGASPEDFQPTPRETERLHDAAVLIENGAGLETWLDSTIASARNAQLVTVVCTTGLPVIGGNPHLWMDPVYAGVYVDKIRAALVARDPAGAAIYNRNARRYQAVLQRLRATIARTISTIPPSHREMIVFHDAWTYYDRRFGLRTAGIIESSPGREPDPATLARIAGIARHDHIQAAFTEPEYSPKLVQALARSSGITTVAQLYDDSLGGDSRVADYVHMLSYDTQTIASALR